MTKDKIKVGDYVLATKWVDGDSQDPWVVSFVDSIEEYNNKPCYMFNDPNITPYLNNQRYRKALKITEEEGKFLLENGKNCLVSMYKILSHCRYKEDEPCYALISYLEALPEGTNIQIPDIDSRGQGGTNKPNYTKNYDHTWFHVTALMGQPDFITNEELVDRLKKVDFKFNVQAPWKAFNKNVLGDYSWI